MYSVLLVDDEESVLHILKVSIDWQELGVDTLLVASDGRMALELFEQRQIDLLVTDIRMPVMDGIELIRNVRRLRPETHCVLLTAYGEFEYAKEAIRLGVDNYLLKPVAKEEVVQTIQSALDNVYQKRQNSETLLKENTLRRWAMGTIGTEELGERAAVLGINLYQPVYCAICLRKRKNTSIAMFRASCLEMLKRQYDVNGFWDEKGRFVILLGGKEIRPEELAHRLEELAYRDKVQDAMALSLGTPVVQAELLHSSYQSACDAIETADLSVTGVIVPVRSDAQGFDADLLAEEIRILFYENMPESRQNGYRHLAVKLCRGGFGEEQLSGFLRACLHVLVKEFPLQTDLQERVYRQIVISNLPVQEEACRILIVEILEKIQQIFAECFTQFSPMVQRTRQYIRGGVQSGEGISIKEFCAGNGITPAYLGHVFKKETGVFFNDYVLQCRIDRSVVLLRNPDRKIKDIAEAVGFASTSYYVKCFREIKGDSPAKYRMDLSRDER